ncbi:MAG TPA: papain-like cysteine protease family protein [Burkholderiaceae bacterium]|nr:papain-like cysteine protease family protein [Burkholderiaceae bacterium]
MTIQHRVPLIGQATNNLCWLSAFQMLEVWYNAFQLKRPIAFSATQIAHLTAMNWGVKPENVAGFARLMGLTIKTAAPDARGVEHLLKTYGPIWYPGRNLGYGPVGTHHVVVIRGIVDNDLLINDPSPVGTGTARRIPSATLFAQLAPLDDQFLVMLADSKPDTVAIFQDLKVR